MLLDPHFQRADAAFRRVRDARLEPAVDKANGPVPEQIDDLLPRQLGDQLAEPRPDTGERGDVGEKGEEDSRPHWVTTLAGCARIPDADIRRLKAYIEARSASGPMSADRLKRLVYRSSYTGTKELDLVLGGFARAHLQDLDDRQLDRYEALVDAENPDIYAWVIRHEPPPPDHASDVLTMIQDYAAKADIV